MVLTVYGIETYRLPYLLQVLLIVATTPTVYGIETLYCYAILQKQ